LSLFHQIRRAGVETNEFMFSSVLLACRILASLKHGMEINEEIVSGGFESDVFVMSVIVDMHAKCGSIEKEHKLFEAMPHRDDFSWTTMIARVCME